jgi:hypothetical protein
MTGVSHGSVIIPERSRSRYSCGSSGSSSRIKPTNQDRRSKPIPNTMKKPSPSPILIPIRSKPAINSGKTRTEPNPVSVAPLKQFNFRRFPDRLSSTRLVQNTAAGPIRKPNTIRSVSMGAMKLDSGVRADLSVPTSAGESDYRGGGCGKERGAAGLRNGYDE